ncbi:MAG: helix-turn-helix transcriptional regulator [Phycisphaerales bacterium JB043]
MVHAHERSHGKATQKPIDVRPTLQSIHETHEYSDSMARFGWDIEYPLLSSSPIDCQTATLAFPAWQIRRENRATGDVLLHGRTASDRCTICLPTFERAGTHLNGVPVGGSEAHLYISELDIHGVALAPLGSVTVHIDNQWLHRELPSSISGLLSEALGSAHKQALSIPHAPASALVDINALFDSSSTELLSLRNARLSLERVFLSMITETLLLHATEHDSLSPNLLCAQEVRAHIDANLHRPLRLSELEQHFRVSSRTIQRWFQEAFAITPREYILTCRLHRARQRLLRSVHSRHARAPVSSIARSVGFTHMGRFSASYKQRFGQLPTETRSLSRIG